MQINVTQKIGREIEHMVLLITRLTPTQNLTAMASFNQTPQGQNSERNLQGTIVP